MSNERLLVIDDEEMINEAVERIASSEGYIVEKATESKIGLELIESNNYDLVLCDIMMPEMDGLQLLDEVNRKNISTPIIVFSGFSTVENAVLSLYKGAIDFVPKPFTYEELISALSRGFKFNSLMSNAGGYNFPKYVSCPPKYLKLGNLSWMHKESEGLVTIGITDLYMKTIGEITKVELLPNDDVIIQANKSAQIFCNDELEHNYLAPIGGKIIERNEKILEDTSLLEKDPFFEGWLYKILPSNLEYDSKYLIHCSSER